MLRSFKFEGFKSLHKVEVDLGIFNVFIGANGSGKSNLLEALGVLGAATSGRIEPETLRYRGVRPGLPSLYKTALKHRYLPRFIKLEAHSESASYRVALDNPINKPEPRWGIHSEALLEGEHEVLTRSPNGCNLHQSDGTLLRLEPSRQETAVRTALLQRGDLSGVRGLISGLDLFAIYTPTTSVLRGLAQDVARAPLGLSGSSLPEAVDAILDRTNGSLGPFDLDEVWEFIDWARNVDAVPAQQTNQSPAISTRQIVLRFTDRFMTPSRNQLTGHDASEGALYVLFLLALAAHNGVGDFVAIDNFDHALHPRLACRLTSVVSQSAIQNRQRQFFLTTHNPLVLDGLDLNRDEIRLFIVDRDPIGASQVTRVQLSDELRNEASRGLSLSRLWTMGRLGGVPSNF